MAGSPTVLSEIDAFTEGRRGRMRPWKWLIVPAALFGVVLLFVPTVVGSVPWAPILHWNCQRGSMVDARTFETPGVFANSPYHGVAWANSSASRLGYVGSDGAAGGTFVPLLYQLFRAHNVTSGGPGPNHRCGARYLAGTSPFVENANGAVPFSTLPLGSVTDVGETAPAAVPSAAYPVVDFTPAYGRPNLPSISTCRSGPVSVTVAAPKFVVEATFYVNGQPVSMPVAINEQLRIHYWFPAGAGIWNAENLASGAGVFAGGWAFAFASCPAPTTLGRVR
jgi:hypothetical protein